MKKTAGGAKTVVGLVLVVLIAAAVIAVLAVMSSFIGKDAAERIAYKDAGIEAPYSRTDLTFANGHFRYEVEFYVDGIEYTYIIRAKDGELLHRNTKGAGALVQQPGVTDTAPAETPAPETSAPETEPATDVPETEAPETTEPTTEPETESATEPETESGTASGSDTPAGAETADAAELAHAEEIAMAGAGLMDRKDDVEFTDVKWYTEGEKNIYELTFVLDETEYQYKVSAFGEVLESSSRPKQN